MPKKKKIKLPTRIALPSSELELLTMAPLRRRRTCNKLKGIEFIYVGSFGTEPNWFARTIPSVVTNACRRKFVSAFAAGRKQFDLMPPSQDESFLTMAQTTLRLSRIRTRREVCVQLVCGDE